MQQFHATSVPDRSYILPYSLIFILVAATAVPTVASASYWLPDGVRHAIRAEYAIGDPELHDRLHDQSTIGCMIGIALPPGNGMAAPHDAPISG